MGGKANISEPRAKGKGRDGWKVWLLVLLGLVFGAGLGYEIGRYLKPSGTKVHIHGWALLLTPLCVLVGIALHEAGHVCGGLVSGFRFLMFVAGPLRIDREGGRLKFLFNRVPALWGGMAACVPRAYGPQLRGHLIAYTLGGPLFSLIGALVLWPGLALRAVDMDASFLLMALGGVSAIIAAATLIPMHHAGFTSDGGRLLMLLRDSAEGRRWAALGAVAGLSTAERPNQWPAELMELLGDGTEQAADAAWVCWLRHLWHLDRREMELAALWLNRGLENIGSLPAALRGALYAAAASYEARFGGKAAMAREYLDQAAKTGFHRSKDLHMATAAVLIAEGRGMEALAELELAAGEAASQSATVAAGLRETIEELRLAAKSRVA